MMLREEFKNTNIQYVMNPENFALCRQLCTVFFFFVNDLTLNWIFKKQSVERK